MAKPELEQALERKHEADAAQDQPLVFLTIKQVCERVGFRKSWVWARVRQSAFPQPVHIGIGARWVSGEIDEWIRKRVDESRKPHEH